MDGSRALWTLLLLAFVHVLVFSMSMAQKTCSNNELIDPYQLSCNFSYPLPPLPTISVFPGGHIIRENGSHLTLTCNVLAPPTSLPTTVTTFTWEYNGILRHINSSTLDIVVSDETAGSYCCIVGVNHVQRDTSLVTAVSNEVHVEPPRIFGWAKEALSPTNQSVVTVTKYLPQGGFTILECQPQTNNPSTSSSATVAWLKNSATIADGDQGHLRLDQWRLLVQNFTLEGAEKEANYTCIVAGLQYFNHDLIRKFQLINSEGTVNSSGVLPANQVVAVGDNVTFHCFTGTGKLSEVSWLKDGKKLNYTGYQPMDFGGSTLITNVLVLQNVSILQGGLYSCVDEAGTRHSAILTVVSPPTNAQIISPVNFLRISDDIITNLSAVNFSCLAESGNPSDISYQWYFRGKLVSANIPGVNRVKDNVVTVSGEQYGSLQCIARNLAGTASTSVILLNKPRPPVNLSYTPKNGSDYKLIYGFNFYPPEKYIVNGTFGGTFIVRTYTYRRHEQTAKVCTKSKIEPNDYNAEGGYNIPVQEDASNLINYVIRMEAALQIAGVISDYVALGISSENGFTCKVPIDIEVIEENFISEGSISHYISSTGSWDLDFVWEYPKSAQSGFLTKCDTSLVCSGETLADNKSCKDHPQFSMRGILSCSVCVWNVTYSSLFGPHLTNTITFATNATAPTIPPNITSISRTGGSGRTIAISFTIPPQLCTAAEIDVYYNGHEIRQSLADNCTRDSSPSSTSSSYTCEVLLEEVECGNSGLVGLTYTNLDPSTGASVGGEMRISQEVQVPNITAANLDNPVIWNLTQMTNSSPLLFHLHYSEDLDCLLNSNSASYEAKVCWVTSSNMDGNSCVNHDHCSNVNKSGFVSISSLELSTSYTFTSVVVGGGINICGPHVIFNTSEAISSVERSSHSTNLYKTLVTVLPICLIAVLVISLVVFLVKKIRSCKKKNIPHHRYAPFPDDEFRGDAPDPIDFHDHYTDDGRSENTSIAGLETGKEYLFKKFLRSQEPDGSVGEASMIDEDHGRSNWEQENDPLLQDNSVHLTSMTNVNNLNKPRMAKDLKKNKKKKKRKKEETENLNNGTESQKETTCVGLEKMEEEENRLEQVDGIQFADSEMNERNQIPTAMGLQGGISSHQQTDSGYVAHDVTSHENRAWQEPIVSVPFTPATIQSSPLTQGEVSNSEYISELTVLSASSNNPTFHCSNAMDSRHVLSQATPLPTHDSSLSIPSSFSSLMRNPQHSTSNSLLPSTNTHPTNSWIQNPPNSVSSAVTPTSTLLSQNSCLNSSGYISSSQFPCHPPPVLDRMSSSGNNTTSSGYGPQSVVYSNLDNHHVDDGACTSGGYIQYDSHAANSSWRSQQNSLGVNSVSLPFSNGGPSPDMSSTNTRNICEGACSTDGGTWNFVVDAGRSIATNANEQDEGFDFINTRVDDDNGSLSSNSVFSDSSISNYFSKPNPSHKKSRPSEGYHSMPHTPKASTEEDASYVNIPEKVNDVHFEFRNNV